MSHKCSHYPNRIVTINQSTLCLMPGRHEFHHSPHEHSTEYANKSQFSSFLRPLLCYSLSQRPPILSNFPPYSLISSPNSGRIFQITMVLVCVHPPIPSFVPAHKHKRNVVCTYAIADVQSCSLILYNQ